MNKILNIILLLTFIIIIFKYFMNIEGMLESEKNTVVDKIHVLANSMKTDYKVFNIETTNMVIQQQRMMVVLGISSFVILGITVYYVMNK